MLMLLFFVKREVLGSVTNSNIIFGDAQVTAFEQK